MPLSIHPKINTNAQVQLFLSLSFHVVLMLQAGQRYQGIYSLEPFNKTTWWLTAMPYFMQQSMSILITSGSNLKIREGWLLIQSRLCAYGFLSTPFLHPASIFAVAQWHFLQILPVSFKFHLSWLSTPCTVFHSIQCFLPFRHLDDSRLIYKQPAETKGSPRLSLGNGYVQKKARTLHQGFGAESRKIQCGFSSPCFRLKGGRTQGHPDMCSRWADLALLAATPPYLQALWFVLALYSGTGSKHCQSAAQLRSSLF